MSYELYPIRTFAYELFPIRTFCLRTLVREAYRADGTHDKSPLLRWWHEYELLQSTIHTEIIITGRFYSGDRIFPNVNIALMKCVCYDPIQDVYPGVTLHEVPVLRLQIF